MGKMKNVYKIWLESLQGRQHLEELRMRRRVDDIKVDLRRTELEGVGWIRVVQDRDRWRALVDMVMNLRVPYKAVNLISSA
jgi:hypothetical protein